MPKNRDNKSGIDILFTMLMFAIIVIEIKPKETHYGV